jgi:hypothetical protein
MPPARVRAGLHPTTRTTDHAFLSKPVCCRAEPRPPLGGRSPGALLTMTKNFAFAMRKKGIRATYIAVGCARGPPAAAHGVARRGRAEGAVAWGRDGHASGARHDDRTRGYGAELARRRRRRPPLWPDPAPGAPPSVRCAGRCPGLRCLAHR